MEKAQRGGIIAKNQKVQNSKFGLFDKRGGVRIFRVFPNLNVDYFETVNASVEQTRPSSESEAATMYKLKGQSSNMRTGQGFK